jgi:serine protease AprX
MATITVNGNTINPEATNHVSRNAKNSNFIYIQGYHDLDIEEKRQLAKMDVEIQEYVAEYTYLCRYTPEDLERIRAVPFVRTANM